MASQAEKRVVVSEVVVEGGEVRQQGFFDLYRWSREGHLRFFRSYERLSAVTRVVYKHHNLGVDIFIRQNLAGRPQWAEYSQSSSSGLGYSAGGNLDRFVEVGKTRGPVVQPVQLRLPLVIETGVGHA